jgi:alpha-glucosidase
MLEFYRTALRIRRDHPALGDGTMTWLDAPEGVLAFSRDPGFVCVVNLSAEPYELPAHSELLLAGGPLQDGVLGPDQAVWLTV